MTIPKAGRAVVVDDVIDEAWPLLLALSKKGVPTLYFTGRKEDLPKEPLGAVRLLFLDIQLGTKGLNRRTTISAAARVVHQLIGKDNGPYVIVAWTKHDDMVPEIKEKIRDRPPVLLLNLEKNECETKNGEYSVTKIGTRLKQELAKIGAFHMLLIWDNLVHAAAGATVNDFSSLYPLDEHWNAKMNSAIYQLAEAYAGKNLDPSDERKVAVDALLSFGVAFSDKLETSIRRFRYPIGLPPLRSSGSIDRPVRARLNSSLLIEVEGFDAKASPCAVYEDKSCKADLVDLFEKDLAGYQNKTNLARNAKHIFVEVSPVCDYAQRKWKVHRVVFGVLWPHPHLSKLKRAEYIFASPEIEFRGSVYKIVLDLRRLSSRAFTTLRGKKPLFRIRHEMLLAIQSRISGHISRPGVIYLK